MIEVENLSLAYRSAAATHLAVDHVSFRVARGQFYTLLGPSGCGKTTALRCVAGLERPDEGEIRIDGAVVSSSSSGAWIPPHRRGVGMVFQSYAIWPHMSVFENVAFPLRYGINRVARREIEPRVRRALATVQLAELADRPAPHLSGGQQQRLALARVLVMEPKLLLLDEPLSNLDAKLREEMRGELRRLVKAIDVTTIFVTHEQIEALTLSDVIAVMKDGRIVQEGAPAAIYERPTDAFVADFIGKSNLVPGTVCARDNNGCVRVASALGELACVAPAPVHNGEAVVVAIRPEHVSLSSEGSGSENCFPGMIEAVSFLGNAMDCTIRCGATAVTAHVHSGHAPSVGGTATLHVAARHCLALRATH
jgi:iron(III) transport system ATP-binding protein